MTNQEKQKSVCGDEVRNSCLSDLIRVDMYNVEYFDQEEIRLVKQYGFQNV
jgi:hypothetical protein